MEAIAIIGIGCRFPGADDPEAFWHLLENGVDAITEVPSSRWDIDSLYDSKPSTAGKMNTRFGGFLKQVDQFDSSFFRISPRETERMDPQQRLILEVAWEALENAGIAPSTITGSQTGVFMGISSYDYGILLSREFSHVNAYNGTGNAFSIAANRLSYFLNLHGPSLTIDTACSSSLVAVHLACKSLQQKESELCLVGGVNLILSPYLTLIFSQAQMMSNDGRCKTFDAQADGYVRGEGCGVVVLKRLEDALRDKDRILAVIRGTAVNQDGLTNGLTAPNGISQQAVIQKALENAEVKANQISYIEAHGTGTALGDPIEVRSLKALLMKNRRPDQPCWLGSVKTNIGHLEAAAGIAGLIKVVLSLQKEAIPPHLHFEKLNPYIKIANTPLSIPATLQKWPRGKERRLAGVSSFGFGGTNCHIILEETPTQNFIGNPIERPHHLLTLSAKNEQALRDLAQKYQDFLTANQQLSLADICFTANTGRSHFDHRLAIVSTSITHLCQQLSNFVADVKNTDLQSGKISTKKEPKIAFLFTGQGSQSLDMGRQLYETQPTFRKTINQCNEILRPYLDQPLLSVLYPDQTVEETQINETLYTQPILFALEYALFQLWKSWGIEPALVMGHSLGEYVAATVAGVFSLEDGLKLVAKRAYLMQSLPKNGKMLAIIADVAKVQSAIQADQKNLAIAAINGPKNVVISGREDVISAISSTLKVEGIKTKILPVSHAFHSPLMEPILDEFATIAAEISYAQPYVPLISNVTGQVIKDEITTPQYWVNHLRQTVKFAESIQTLHQHDCDILLEIGPKTTMLSMARHCLPENNLLYLPSLQPGQEDWQQLLHSLRQMYLQGAKINWTEFDRDYPRNKVTLPTYPFQRKRYWIETDHRPVNQPSSWQLQNQTKEHPLLGYRLKDLANLPNTYIWEVEVDQEYLLHFPDNQIAEKVIMPHTAYIKIALAATEAALDIKCQHLTDFQIYQPLILSAKGDQKIQFILSAETQQKLSFSAYNYQIHQPSNSPKWTLYATTQIHI